MRGRSGRSLAFGSAALGMAVLGGSAVHFREAIREAWHLRALERGDDGEQRRAIEVLGDMGSVRAAPLILRRLSEMGPEFESVNYVLIHTTELGMACPIPAPYCRALERTAVSAGGRMVAPLVSGLEDETWGIRYACASVLGKIGAGARDALPALERTLEDEDHIVRNAALLAIQRISR